MDDLQNIHDEYDWDESPQGFIQRLRIVARRLDAGEAWVGDFVTEWTFASDDNPTWVEWVDSMTPHERTAISAELARLGARYDADGGWSIEHYAKQIADWR